MPPSPSILRLSPVAALLVAVALLSLGHGLLSSALTLRALGAGEDSSGVGIFMSAHFIGLLVGATTCQKMIMRVGRIRVFAAFASLMSVVSLVHLVVDNLIAWSLLRFMHGYCFAAIGVVVESWLNGHALPQTRGRILALYGVVSTLALGGGQLLLNFAPPSGFALLVLSSALASLSLLPIALTGTRREPIKISSVPRLPLAQMWRLSPLGVTGAVISGAVFASLLALGPVYGRDLGFSRSEIALFMAAPLVSSVIFQFPLGWLSDQIDRRYVIIGAAGCAALAAAGLLMGGVFWQQWGLALLLGGFFLPLYPLCLSRANDEIGDSALLATAGAIMMLFAAGSMPAPLLAGLLMRTWSPAALFAWISGLLALLAVFGLWQLFRRPRLLSPARRFWAVPAAPTPPMPQIDPRADQEKD